MNFGSFFPDIGGQMLSVIAMLFVLVGIQPEKPKDATATPARIESSRGELVRREWMMGDTKRVASVWMPAQTIEGPRPVVFAFHGHGGSAKSASKNFGYHEIWPEAICVYMEGLPTKGITDPEGKKNGWQKQTGEYEDRDLKFFDTVLESLRTEGRMDPARVYVTGHSNGGGFTYLLWAVRDDVFAAVAPSAGGGLRHAGKIKPLPAIHIAGKKDKLVSFMLQSKMMQRVRELNGCKGEGILRKDGCREYVSSSGNPCVEYVFDGGHEFPNEAPEMIVAFFKQHARKVAEPSEPKE
jgi:polyhydroxybutyrate depolymerase